MINWNKRSKIWLGAIFFVLLLIMGILVDLYLISSERISYEVIKKDIEKVVPISKYFLFYESSYGPMEKPPPAPDIERMKKQGCITDGILSGKNGNIERNVKMIKRSNCYYLHRALETWLEVPDFKKARKIKKDIGNDNMVYGMFIAEALDKKSKLYYPDEDRYFYFPDMCRDDMGINYWGEHTCIPSLRTSEYRKYVKYITERAMDMGIQSFLFGQVFYQDQDRSSPKIDNVIEDMKEYAEFRKMKIVIGAQTNDIEDKDYLRLFDFIEGGVGISSDGTVENGPCFSRWYKKPGDWCWALLWNEKFSKKAKNVFLHLDWSGKKGDDMSIFARMSKKDREKTLKDLYSQFTSMGHGFMLPMVAVLPEKNGGCYGKKERYYSADRKYSCNDEDAVNAILKKAEDKIKQYAEN